MRWWFLMALAACQGGDPPAPDDTDTTEPDTDTVETDTVDTDPPDSDTVDTDVPDSDTVETDTQDTDPVDTDTGITPPVNPCTLTAADVPRATYREVGTLNNYVDAAWVYGGTTSAQVIQDQAAYDQLALDLGIELEPVDFTTETVFFGWRGVTSTCGLTEQYFDVLTDPATSEVIFQLAVFDSSGNCPIACDMIQVIGRIVAAPRSLAPTVCTRDLNQCP